MAPVTRELLTVLTAEDICLNDVPENVWHQLGDDSPALPGPLPTM